MTQGFVLHCVVTGSAYKNDLDGKIVFLHCVTVQIILYALLIAMQTLASYYKPASTLLHICTLGNYSLKNKPMVKI